MKKLLSFLLPLAFLAGCATPPASTPTGLVYPTPQQVSGEPDAIPVAAPGVRFVWHGDLPADLTALAEEIYFSALGNLPAASAAQDLVVHVGEMTDPEIFELMNRSHRQPLPLQGYLLRDLGVCPADGARHVLIAGGGKPGAVYGVATLAQLLDAGEDGAVQCLPAEIVDYPVWKTRFIADYAANHNADGYKLMIANKINGAAAAFGSNWRKLDDPEYAPTIQPVLEAIKKYTGLGLIEVMALMHLYQHDKSLPQLNVANPADVQELVEACRRLAQNGVRYIMIGADDLTPYNNQSGYAPYHKEELEKFGSVGAAHGALMTMLYDALIPEFPDLQLSMVGAPYSLGHGIGRENVDSYLVDWGKNAPRDVLWVWTGKEVFSPEVTAEELKRVTDLLSGQRVYLWDNSNGFFSPMPRWETLLYPGMEADTLGQIYLNGCFFRQNQVSTETLYNLTACDYLWNPAQYDPDRSYRTGIELLMGKAAVEPVVKMRDIMAAWDRVHYTGIMEENMSTAAEFEAAINAADEAVRNSCGHSLNFANYQNRQIKLPRAYFYETFAAPEVDVPSGKAVKLDGVIEPEEWADAAEIQLTDAKSETDPSPTTVKMFYDANGLYLAFTMPFSEPLPERESGLPRDEAVFTAPDAVEVMLQFVPVSPDNLGAYIHIVFDYEGNIFDEPAGLGGVDWDADFRLAVRKNADNWTAELFVPPQQTIASKRTVLMETNLTYIDRDWGAVPPAPAPGQVWKGNFFRAENRTGKVQEWSRGGFKFHLPGYFGTLNLK